MNKLIISGNLTRNPEMNRTQDGTEYSKFTVAVDRMFGRDKTDFFNCTAWAKRAELVGQYLKKGDRVLITGRIEFDDVERDGRRVTYHSVTVEDIEFLTPRSQQEQSAPPPTAPPPLPFQPVDEQAGDLPF